MSIPLAGGKRFGLDLPHQYFDKLEWEFHQIMTAGDAGPDEITYRFMNLVVTAWHMTDWTYPHLPDGFKAQFKRQRDFQEWIKRQSRVLAACRDIATAAKHFTVDQSPDRRVETIRMPHAKPAYHLRFYTIAVDGQMLEIDQFFREVITFWQCFLDSQGLLPD